MKTYVIQHKRKNTTNIEICQGKNVTEVIKFLSEKYENGIGHIEYIYSEEYEEENEKNTHYTR